MSTQTHNWVLFSNLHHQQNPYLHHEEEEEDDDDSLSLSDFPVSSTFSIPSKPPQADLPQEGVEEFEFKTFTTVATAIEDGDMCSADEVFFKGQLLPMKPSLCSRSESLERCSSSATNSLRFDSTCSSSSMSRSHSTDSSTSTGSESRHVSISNFYAHPSPKPGVCTKKNVNVARRRSVSGSVGLFGVVRAPEIELDDLRQRRRNRGMRRKKVGKLCLFGDRLSCNCSVSDVTEPKKKKEEAEG